MTQPRRLIVNADDFALSPGVTAGILEAHAAGVVTSTSMMVGCPGWDDGVRRARAAPTLDFGLHFNVLVGAPRTDARSLCGPRGTFASLAVLARRALTGRIRPAEVAAECEAQLAALVDAGIHVTHVDSHRHVHALPGVRGAVARVAARHGLALRRPVESRRFVRGHLAGRARATLVSMSWRMASAGAAPVRIPDYLAGLSWSGGRHFASGLARIVDALPAGITELVVHPGCVDDVLSTVDGYTLPRETELRALTDPALGDRLRQRRIALIDFRDL